jgi:hypothetical protein
MKFRGLTLVLLGVALAAPASAQIIATSIPGEGAAGGGTGSGKRFALHLMASPVSKWRYNELIGGVLDRGDRIFLDSGVFTGTPNSDFLLAGELAFRLSDSWSAGVGGWYNKVGKVDYRFNIDSLIITADDVFTDSLTGSLDGDLTVSEGHVNLFYKDFGIQGGIVKTRSTITNSRIETSVSPDNIGQPLGSVEGDENKATDLDLYGVYKMAGGESRPWSLSVGAGIYRKKGNTESGQRLAEDQTLPSGFVAGSVTVWKGLGIDASYWYVGKTKAVAGDGVVSSNTASRFTIGVGYTFSN